MFKDGGKLPQLYKRNVEWLLKQSLNTLNIDSTCFKTVERGELNGLTIAVPQNRMDVETDFPGLKGYGIVAASQLDYSNSSSSSLT